MTFPLMRQFSSGFVDITSVEGKNYLHSCIPLHCQNLKNTILFNFVAPHISLLLLLLG
jgi:hypothetical protein